MRQNYPLKQLSISRVTENGTSIAGFSAFGASCTNLSLLGNELITPSSKANTWDNFFGTLLAPWPNRLKDGKYSLAGQDFQVKNLDPQQNANHGLLGMTALEIRAHLESKIIFGHRFGSDEYPFDVDLEVTYEISDEFVVSAVARNLGETPAPFAIGFHPYYRIPGEVKISANITKHLIADQRLIPVGEEAMPGLAFDLQALAGIDDCYFGDWTLQLETGEFALEISQQNLPYLMLYKPAESTFLDGTASLAIEPMSAPANAFQSQLERNLIPAGKSREFSYRVRILN